MTGGPTGGGYEIGWKLTPLTGEQLDQLDMTGDWKGGIHKPEEDPLFKLAGENRDRGNKCVKEGRHEEAVAAYSELIMQLRGLSEEKDVEWDDAGTEAVRQLRASAYLNLSLCFLKTQQWTHARNTATRALVGDKDPVDPKEDVLAPEKKAKALFRRAQCHSEGFKDFDKAKLDLEKALEYAPQDKAIREELQRIKQIVKKSEKAQDKQMAGFFNNAKKVQSGEGIFSDKLRPTEESLKEPELKEVKKLSDGLWLAPKQKEEEDDPEKVHLADGPLDLQELSREVLELREDNPKVYDRLREQVREQLEEAARLDEEERAKEAKEGKSTEEGQDGPKIEEIPDVD